MSILQFPRPSRMVRLARVATVVGVLLLVAGLVSLSPSTPVAHAAEDVTDSAITVKWLDDNSLAKEFQPVRDPSSIHYGDFRNVEVTVSQTSDLIDQTVRVDVSGMPGATAVVRQGGWNSAYNFVQAMQCWGDPEDPTFYETCQWGGMGQGGNGAIQELPLFAGGFRGTYDSDVPFRNVYSETLASLPFDINIGAPYHRDFNAATTNEVLDGRVASNGSGQFDFEVQSADSAPHLGCGVEGEGGAGERCWLVVVPRGEHSEPDSPDCPLIQGAGLGAVAGMIQSGSPINPACGYWRNRIVVPLDFRASGETCPPGAAERPTSGSPLIERAMSSWQPVLCRTTGSTFAFNSAPDSVSRAQLLSGQTPLAFLSEPLTPENLPEGIDASVLDDAEIVYTPVAVSAPALAFYAQSANDGRIEGLTLTPRLVAKLLTVSYTTTVPSNTTSRYFEHVQGNQASLLLDPEFTALNGETFWNAGAPDPGLIMVGSGMDAIAQLWRWIQADDQARAFLAGDPDESAMRINPYYLPKGHPNAKVLDLEEVANGEGRTTLRPKPGNPMRDVGLAHPDGSPLCLCDAPLDTIPWADETQVPRRLTTQNRRFDLVQFNPPLNTLHDVAVNIQRGNRNMKTGWDPGALNAAGERGDWISGRQVGGASRFLIGFADAAEAARYSLSQAQLQLPNRPGVYVAPDEAGLLAALDAQTPTGVDGVTQTDMAELGDGAFPLTMVTYAAIDLQKTTRDDRTAYADMLEYATTTGQQPGLASGELPPGYAPLTPELRQQAAVAIREIRDYVDEVQSGDIDVPPDFATRGSDVLDADLSNEEYSGGENSTTVDGPANTVEAQATTTQGSSTTPIGLAALGGTLLLGASGAALGPILLRRKESH